MCWGTDRDAVRLQELEETTMPVSYVPCHCFLEYLVECLVEGLDCIVGLVKMVGMW